MDRDHVAALDSQPSHRVGKAPAERAYLAEGVGFGAALVVREIQRRLIAEIGMTIEAIYGDVVVGRDIPSMACARLGDALRTVDGLLPKADDAHGWLLRSGGCAMGAARPREDFALPPKSEPNPSAQFHQLGVRRRCWKIGLRRRLWKNR